MLWKKWIEYKCASQYSEDGKSLSSCSLFCKDAKFMTKLKEATYNLPKQKQGGSITCCCREIVVISTQ